MVVQFQVVLKKKLDDPLKPVRAHITASKNKFGTFGVDSNSVKEES